MVTNIKKSEIVKNIFLLSFETAEEMSSMFLRFQEHYESPEFRGKIFSLEEFKKWYTKEKGSFSYYTDWSGFNIPSEILKPFFEGKFDPLSEKEKYFLNLFKEEEHPFYIIGIYGKHQEDKTQTTLKHEVAHGFFYTNQEYREKVREILSKYDLTGLKNWLKSLGGYHDDVLEDECHAFSLTGSLRFKLEIPSQLKESLEKVFDDTLKQSGAKL